MSTGMSTNDPDPREAEQPRPAQRSGYQRTKADKFDRLAVELEALGEVLETVPKEDFPKLAGMSRTTAQKKIASFRSLLLQAKQHPVAYSFLLQQCLYSIGVEWPEGVFADDFASPGSGRKRTDLGFDALGLYETRKFGWRKVARKLIPEEYKTDKAAAVAKVYKAAANALDQRSCLLTELKKLSPAESQKRLALFLKMHAESHFPHDRRRMSLEERLKEAAKWPDPFRKTEKRPQS
jgi:hypothetical protein